MKTIRFIPVFFFLFAGLFSAKAQDFLVTKSLDSLNCKLGQLENGQYPIMFYLDNEKIYGHIPEDSILFFKRNMFRSIRSNRLMPWYPLKEFSIDAGVGHQFGKFRLEDEMAVKSEFAAKTGFYANTDIVFYMTKTFGYGLKYNFRSLLGGDILYQYVGPMAAFRFWNQDRKNYWFFHASGGLGWMRQKNAPIQRFEIRPILEMRAQAFSGDLSAGYNFRLSPNISLRTKLSAIIGFPSFVKIADYNKLMDANDLPLELGDYCKNMNTVNLSVGITFHSAKPYE